MTIGDATNGQTAPLATVEDLLEEPATSSAAMEAPTEAVTEAKAAPQDPVAAAAQLSAAGARFHALKKFSDAADAYSKACELVSAHYGDLAPETGDAWLAYGSSLLEYCRSQNSVLGMGQAGNPTVAEGSSEQPVAGSSRVQPEASGSKPRANDRIHFSGDSSEDEAEPEPEPAEADAQQAFNLDDELENAFNALDSARVAFSKVANGDVKDERAKEARKKEIKALDLLGDIHSESEQFENAVERYKEALALKELDPSAYVGHDRVLAEAHLMIALAYEYVIPDGVASAIKHAEEAQRLMHVQLSSLVALRDAGTATSRDADEIADIESLMGELDAKVDELKTVPQEDPNAQSAQDRALEEYLSQMPHLRQGMGTGPSGLGGDAVVNDLNMLVKKKKAPATAAAADAAAPAPAPAPLAAVDEGTVKAAEQAVVPTLENGAGKRKAEPELDGQAEEVPTNGAAAKRVKTD